MTLLLDENDRQALLGVVREFAEAELRPLVLHPEEPPEEDLVSRALDQLAAIGVLRVEGDDQPGVSLWEAPEDPASCRLSLDMLEGLASVSPGVATRAHLQALATWLDRSAGTPSEGAQVTLTPAASGAGRAMGTSLHNGADGLRDDEHTMLASVWGEPTAHPRLVFGSAAWSHLWWPEWSTATGWRLRRTPRGDLAVDAVPRLHGLDELTCHEWRLEPAASPGNDPVLEAVATVDAFATFAMGLLAIALATTRRTLDRSRAYSRIRHQGGVLIERHDAVAELLARGESTVATGRAVLDRLATLPAGVDRLHRTWQASAQLHPLLSAAGSNALQVLGGIGYMRDIGAEKDQRDLNTLRRIGGSPGELTLRCAALDEVTSGSRS